MERRSRNLGDVPALMCKTSLGSRQQGKGKPNVGFPRVGRDAAIMDMHERSNVACTLLDVVELSLKRFG
jgi:hypothetical protein